MHQMQVRSAEGKSRRTCFGGALKCLRAVELRPFLMRYSCVGSYGGVLMQALKNVGMTVLGLGVMVGLGIVTLIYLQGIVWVSVRVFDYVVMVNSAVFLLSVFIFLPCAIFRVTRKVAAFGLLGASYVFGLTVWLFGFLVTYAAWGIIGVFIGLVFAGVGIVPVGMVASGLHGEWDVFWQLVLGIAFTFGARGLAAWLAVKVDQHEEEKLEKAMRRGALPSY
jgi:hypothetical protein